MGLSRSDAVAGRGGRQKQIAIAAGMCQENSRHLPVGTAAVTAHAAMRYVETARLMSTGLGKEGDLLLTVEPIVASARVACALQVRARHSTQSVVDSPWRPRAVPPFWARLADARIPS